MNKTDGYTLCADVPSAAAADCRIDGEPLLVPYKQVWLLPPQP